MQGKSSGFLQNITKKQAFYKRREKRKKPIAIAFFGRFYRFRQKNLNKILTPS